MELIKTTTILERVVNVYGTPENPLFLAKDVAEWIGHTNVSKMISDANLDETEYVKTRLSTLTNSYNALMITEDGLYEVLMQSRKPIAKTFKKGVKEMLKSVRKHGLYATPSTTEEILNNPDVMIALLQNLKTERAEKEQLKIANAKLQNRSDVYDKVFGSEKYLSGLQVCKILDLGYGNITFYKKLREIGIFFKNRNEPMQQYANKKWIMLKEKWIDGKEEPVVTPYFSQTFIPHLAIKLGAVVNNLTKIQVQ
ncbi:hypothetical protein CMU09_18005 [Elizabethkingia anophelis]|uniref:BRO family protein n=1 Tax=Elizabethkingia anophelis TaxID=1117645 RepID=UPI002013453D|nr:BRO family protein [Elizabethkingia anophelis]EJC8061970.1 phage antirepressor KilAC domain-containing protein [Elizabethkingia anophelis]MCL1640062.1 phage antirepressor KilAC domain-containing protein [Elizabethkingia anophelis]MDV3551081.1 hypothetical protein [Elizabethkingia anophelis]MDV3570091.1 hypothetical protein [Elizabethkingia anophelis]MDV3593810.1 hypothetical protein [Elizabethkingia anophelis]